MFNENTLPGDSMIKAATNKWMHQIAVIAIMMVLYSGWLRAMVWIISRQWWKPGQWFPQRLHKHVFCMLSLECVSNADIKETARTPFPIRGLATVQPHIHDTLSGGPAD